MMKGWSDDSGNSGKIFPMGHWEYPIPSPYTIITRDNWKKEILLKTEND
jgi:hypothetical protein